MKLSTRSLRKALPSSSHLKKYTNSIPSSSTLKKYVVGKKYDNIDAEDEENSLIDQTILEEEHERDAFQFGSSSSSGATALTNPLELAENLQILVVTLRDWLSTHDIGSPDRVEYHKMRQLLGSANRQQAQLVETIEQRIETPDNSKSVSESALAVMLELNDEMQFINRMFDKIEKRLAAADRQIPATKLVLSGSQQEQHHQPSGRNSSGCDSSSLYTVAGSVIPPPPLQAVDLFDSPPPASHSYTAPAAAPAAPAALDLDFFGAAPPLASDNQQPLPPARAALDPSEFEFKFDTASTATTANTPMAGELSIFDLDPPRLASAPAPAPELFQFNTIAPPPTTTGEQQQHRLQFGAFDASLSPPAATRREPSTQRAMVHNSFIAGDVSEPFPPPVERKSSDAGKGNGSGNPWGNFAGLGGGGDETAQLLSADELSDTGHGCNDNNDPAAAKSYAESVNTTLKWIRAKGCQEEDGASKLLVPECAVDGSAAAKGCQPHEDWGSFDVGGFIRD